MAHCRSNRNSLSLILFEILFKSVQIRNPSPKLGCFREVLELLKLEVTINDYYNISNELNICYLDVVVFLKTILLISKNLAFATRAQYSVRQQYIENLRKWADIGSS